jgi:hypothetical protein
MVGDLTDASDTEMLHNETEGVQYRDSLHIFLQHL